MDSIRSKRVNKKPWIIGGCVTAAIVILIIILCVTLGSSAESGTSVAVKDVYEAFGYIDNTIAAAYKDEEAIRVPLLTDLRKLSEKVRVAGVMYMTKLEAEKNGQHYDIAIIESQLTNGKFVEKDGKFEMVLEDKTKEAEKAASDAKAKKDLADAAQKKAEEHKRSVALKRFESLPEQTPASSRDTVHLEPRPRSAPPTMDIKTEAEKLAESHVEVSPRPKSTPPFAKDGPQKKVPAETLAPLVLKKAEPEKVPGSESTPAASDKAEPSSKCETEAETKKVDTVTPEVKVAEEAHGTVPVVPSAPPASPAVAPKDHGSSETQAPTEPKTTEATHLQGSQQS
nr:hypothetical protein MACL_00000182 [Theileria orientalis]